MNIADICTREIVFADRGDSLQRAASLMREHHVGIVTDRDVVVEAVARGLDVNQTDVGRFADGKLAAVPARVRAAAAGGAHSRLRARVSGMSPRALQAS